MKIREAKKSDNLKEIAELIYETDKYIYPSMYESKQQTIKTLIEMIESNTMYNYQNCIVAIQDSHIVGLIVYISNENSNYNYDKWITSNKKCKHVIENYMLTCEDDLENNQINLICVCVKPKYRRQKIGTQLIKYIFKKFPNKSFILDTLKNNLGAIKLYTSMGFKIIQEHKGYNKYYKHKPICYRMEKTI